jgi:hypothetical protein
MSDDAELNRIRRRFPDFGLFSQPLEQPSPAARSTDPHTSHAAGRKRRVTQAMRLLAAYADGVPRTDEAAVDAAGMHECGSPWKRASDLRRAGFIAYTGHDGMTARGSSAILCVITDKGRAALRND